MSIATQDIQAAIQVLLNGLAGCKSSDQTGQLIFKVHQFIGGLDPADATHVLLARPLVEAMLNSIFARIPENINGVASTSVMAFLAAPTLNETWLSPAVPQARWQDMHHNLMTEAARRPTDFAVIFLLIVCEGMLLGPKGALVKFMDRLSYVNFETTPDTAGRLGKLGSGFMMFGWLDQPFPELTEKLEAATQRQIGFGSSAFNEFVRKTLAMWRFDVSMSAAWLDFLTHALMVPALKAAAHDTALAELALHLDELLYLVPLKKTETQAAFKNLYATIGPLLTAAGEQFGRAHPMPPRALRPAHERVRVAFFLWGDFTTAHAAALFLLLRAMNKLDSCPLQLFVLVVDRPGGNLQYLLDAVANLNVTVRWPDMPKTTVADDILWMRRQAAADDIDSVIFVSVTMMVCFMAGLGLAPVHTWWTLKYHDLYVPQIQGYLALGLFGRLKLDLGPNWTIADVCTPELTDLSLAPEARHLAHEYSEGGKYVLLGCMGRSEKLVDPRYGRSLARILRACPDAKFLYTGRTQRPEFTRILAEEGITDRCHFIGWINTKLYAQVLDVQVDSFPFASGITTMEMMAVGRPAVTLLTPESMETSAATYFVPVYRGEIGGAEDQAFVQNLFRDDEGPGLFPFAETIEMYENLAIRLTKSADLRARVGAACRAFIERYMRNEARHAHSMGQEIMKIIHGPQHPGGPS